MQSFADLAAQGYRLGAPSLEAEEIDSQVAQSICCHQCGGTMHYEGFHRPGEYHALAVCNRCGYVMAF